MPCPICKAKTQHEWRPFCSRRCADRDLGQWLSDGYVLPGTGLEEDAAEISDEPPGRPLHH